MSLFTPDELVLIREEIETKSGNILVTFKNKHGPTKLKELWIALLQDLGFPTGCLHWWSSSGTLGLLECDNSEGQSFYGQWALSDETKLIGVFEISDEDIVDIREGYDAGNVVSSEMRAIRIGETGDKD
jgi:hypothetical protein